MLFVSAFFTQPQSKSTYNVSFGRPQHLHCDGQFYTSTDESPLPSPIPSLNELQSNPSIKDLRSRLWSLNKHPYLAFILHSPASGPLMSRFAHFDPSVIVCSSSTGLWHLPVDTAKSWKRFEHIIRRVAEKLQLYFTTENPNIPVIWEAPEKPSLYGYFVPHATCEVATVAINNSIDGFIVYTAYISFLIGLCQCTASFWQGPSIENIFRKAGIEPHMEWVSGLLESGIGDFATTRRRVGSIVNVDQCQWLNLVPYMIQCKVPIWLCWGPQLPHPHANIRLSWIWHFYPNNLPTSSPQLPVPAGFPSVKPGCNQLPGETWKAFFERRAVKNAEKRKKENAKDREARLNRAKANKTHKEPGRKGPRVYYWEKINGFRIRTLWTRSETQMSFDGLKNSNRIYDAFSNAWDCCSEFEFSPRDEDEMDSDDDGPPYSWLKPKERDSQLQPPLLPPTSLPGLSASPQPEHPPSSPSLPLASEAMDVDKSDHSGGDGHNSDAQPVPNSGLDLFSTSSLKQDFIPVDPSATIVEPPSSSLLPPPSLGDSDPPPTSLPGLSTSLQHAPSSSLPLAAMDIDRSDRPERDGHNAQPVPDLGLDQFNTSSLRQDVILVDPSAPIVEPLSSSLLPPPGPRERDPPPTSLPGLSTSLQHAPSSSSLRPLEAMDIDRLDHPERDGHNAQPVPDLELDLFKASKQDVISVNPAAPVVEPPPEPQSLEELLYFRYGYTLDKQLDQPMPSFSQHNPKHFNTWLKICRSVGGQAYQSESESSAVKNLESIREFLVALDSDMSNRQALHVVPAKFWDLSPWNNNSLSGASNIYIKVKHFNNMTLCLLHMRTSEATSWQVAVSPMTALECIRRNLGPCRNDVVNYLLSRGMEFYTLQTLEVLPPPTPVLQPLLRHRPTGYVFDQADFLAYESSRDSFLQSHPSGRRALCEGGIIARLARESMSDTLVFQGPSEEALEGKCGVFTSSDGIMVDDHLPQDVKDLICGTYIVKSGSGGKFQ